MTQILSSPTTPASRPSAEIHVPALDGLRGLAILAVLLCHFPQRPPDTAGLTEWTIYRVMARGQTGVDLFFVLSGFLITNVLLANRDAPGRAWNFYGRRALRIFPLYYGIIGTLLLLPYLGATWHELEPFRQLQPWYWLHGTNWLTIGAPITQVLPAGTAAMWSLSVEEQFYLLWPAVVWRVPSRRVCWIAGIMLGVGFLGRVGLAFLGADWRILRCSTFSAWDGLAVGAVIAVLWRDHGHQWDRARAAAPKVLAWCGAGVAVGTVLFPFQEATYTRIQPLETSLLALGFGALLILTLRGPDTHWRRLMSGRVIRAFGRYSYGLYLLHNYILILLLQHPPHVAGAPLWTHGVAGQLAFALVGVVLSLAVAVPVWHAYERPFLRLKGFFPTQAWTERNGRSHQ